MWDFSLVDPDNRRPVDFESALTGSEQLQRQAGATIWWGLCRELLQNYRDGRIKLWVTTRALNFRRDHKELFQAGSYVPSQRDEQAEKTMSLLLRVSTTARQRLSRCPALSYTLMKGKEEPPLGAVWGDSRIAAAAGSSQVSGCATS